MVYRIKQDRKIYRMAIRIYLHKIYIKKGTAVNKKKYILGGMDTKMYFFGFRCYINLIIILNCYFTITPRVIFPKKFSLSSLF